MLRVLHVLPSGARGGGAAHLLGLLPALRDHGVMPLAAVGHDGPLARQLAHRGVPVAAWPSGARQSVPLADAVGRLADFVRRQRVDVVHCHGSRAAAVWPLWALARPALCRPLFYTVHNRADAPARGPLEAALRRRLEAWACRGKRAVFCVGEEDRRQLVQAGAVSALRALTVPNAIDPVPFAAARARSAHLRASLRASLGIAPATRLVGTVARLVRQKDVACAARAVARLPDVHLLVVGDGPERAGLASSACARAGRLHLLGGRDDVPELLAGMDAFVLSSRWESQGIVLLEAMAASLPWVATATPGAREVAARARTGELVPLADDAALAARLSAILRSADPAGLSRGRQFVDDHQWDSVARAVSDRYFDCCAS